MLAVKVFLGSCFGYDSLQNTDILDNTLLVYSVPLGSLIIFGPTFFLLYMNGHPHDVICNITICANDTNVYSKCDQASDLWEQLELASELESHL